MSTGRPLRRHAGFSLRGMPLVAALAAALAGLGLACDAGLQSNRVSSASETTVAKVKALLDSWKHKFQEHSPTRLDAIK